MAEYLGMITTAYQNWRLILEDDGSITINKEQKTLELKKTWLIEILHQLWCFLDWHEEAELTGAKDVERDIIAAIPGYSLKLKILRGLDADVPGSYQRRGGEAARLFLELKNLDDKVTLRLHVSKLQTLVNILRRGCLKARLDITEIEAAHDIRQQRLWDKLTGVDLSGMEKIDLEEVL